MTKRGSGNKRRQDRPEPSPAADVTRGKKTRIPVVLAAGLVALILAVFAWWIVVVGKPGAGTSGSAASRVAPPASGLSPSAAARLLRLPSDVPQTVDGLKQEAARTCEQLTADLPDRPEAHALAALSAKRFGQTTEAVRRWEKSLALDPDFSPALFGIASVAKERAEYEKAAELLHKAIGLDPRLEGASNLLVEVLLDQGKAQEALPVARRQCEAFPDSCEGWFWLGQSYLQLKDYEAARQAHEKAITLDPRFTLSYHSLATICARLKDRSKADQYRRKFAELKEADLGKERDQNKFYQDLDTGRATAANTHLCAGNIYWSVVMPEKAEAHWVRAAAIDPRDVASREALAACYEKQGRLADAARVREELLALEPQNVGCLTALVKIYLEGEWNLPEAAEHARKAVALEPTAANYVLLSATLQQNGDRAGALAAAERAMKLAPDSDEPRQIYEFLKNSE